MCGFFLPWKDGRQEKKAKKKLYLPKERCCSAEAAFDKRNPAYVSLPNPKGTLRSFLQAVKNGKKEEALEYFSAKVVAAVDYEAVEKILLHLQDYYCFIEEEGSGIRRICVAKKNEQDKEIFSFCMISEPNRYGKWKIVSIETEGNA